MINQDNKIHVNIYKDEINLQITFLVKFFVYRREWWCLYIHPTKDATSEVMTYVVKLPLACLMTSFVNVETLRKKIIFYIVIVYDLSMEMLNEIYCRKNDYV